MCLKKKKKKEASIGHPHTKKYWRANQRTTEDT